MPLKDIVDLILKVKVGAYVIEGANPRHEHEWQVWKDVKLASGQVLIPGVISHATNVVEHPELVAERIVRLARIVGRENVIAGTDCGFAQGPFYRRVHPVDHVGEARGAGRGRPACEQGTLVNRLSSNGATLIGSREPRLMNISAQLPSGLAIPFDHHRLDRLMDEAGIDVVIATSKHNVQYLLGGHRANFFDYMDATGVTRYLPVFVYPKGAPEKAAYIGHRLEKFQREVKPMWTPETQTNTAGSVDAMQKAVDYIRKAGLKPKRIAAEFGFLPYDAARSAAQCVSRCRLGRCAVRAGAPAREEIAEELQIAEIRIRSGDRVHAGGDRRQPSPASPRHEVVEALRREETNRGLTFEYCLITAAPASTARPPTRNGRRARSCRSIPAATITAISATSAAWRSRASRTPN